MSTHHARLTPVDRQLLTTVAAVMLAGGIASMSLAARHIAVRPAARPFPTALVGSWTRRITPADDRRFGIQGADYKCLNTITVARSGNITLRSTGCQVAADNTVNSGTITPIAARVIRIDFGVLPNPPVVAWSVSGRVLRLKALRSPDQGERELWTGTWNRKR